MNGKKEFADKLLSEPSYKRRLRMIKEICINGFCDECIFYSGPFCKARNLNKKAFPQRPSLWEIEDLQENPEPEKTEVKMTRKRLKKLWKIKRHCEKQNDCSYCGYFSNKTNIRSLPVCYFFNEYANKMTVPVFWNLPPLPKKKRFKDRFVLGEKIDKKLNKGIVKALYIKGYYSITCNVWDYDKKNKNEEEIISITSDCRYISESGFDFMHAEPVER